MEDVKEKHSQKIVAEKIKEQKKIKETLIIKEISKKQKSDWRNDLGEGMTSSNAFAVALPAVDGDGDVSVIDPLDASNFSPVKMPEHIGQEGGVGADGIFDSAFVGTVIRDSGTGSGDDGGFDVGGQYLAFQGTGAPNNNARFACLGAIDATLVDTLTITAIVGNDSNGGETPDLQSECLFLYYKTPTMERAESIQLNFNPPYDGQGDGIIIKTPLDGQDGRGVNNGGLNNYSITIPDYARVKDTVFVLYQNFNSGSSFDNYGITDIRFQRKTPSNVFVPLDSPEAISFVRVGTDEGDPKKRKKNINARLLASDEYVAKSLAAEFPGTGTRVGDDDPFASAKIGDDAEPSPQNKDQVTQAFTAAKLKTALGKPAAAKVADPEKKLKEILKNTKPDTGLEKTGKDLAVFRSDAENKKTDVAVTQEAKNSVKTSPEISEIIEKMTVEQKKAAIEKMYPEKAQEILDTADNSVLKAAIEEIISATIVDSIADITQPLLGAETSANAFNVYNRFLGDIVKDPNTPGATYENPKDMSNQITKGDMNDLTKTINSGNYQSIVNSIRATNNKKTQKKLKGELEAMIKETIQGNFGLDNFLHNNVKVNLDHLLKTGKTKLTKEYTFKPGGTIEGVEDASSWEDGFAYGAKLVADALGLEYDTLGAPKIPFPQSFDVGGVNVIPGQIINVPVALATTFGPAIIAKLGLTNTKNFGDSAYKSPGMYYEVDVPGKYSVDKKGVPIQSEEPSTFENIKQNLSNLFSFGEEDENAPQREDYPMGRDGAQKYSDDMEEYKNSLTTPYEGDDRIPFDTGTNLTGKDPIQIPKNLRNIFSADEMQSVQNLGFSFEEIQQILDNGDESILNDAIEAEKFGEITDPTTVNWDNEEEVEYYMNKYFDDKPLPQDNTWILMILAAHPKTRVVGGILKIIQTVGKWYNKNKIPGPKGEEGWTWEKLLKDDWLKRQISDNTGKWNPFRFLYTWASEKGGFASGPTPLVREFIRRLGPLGAELLTKITDFGFEEHIKPEIEGYDSDELIDKLNEIYEASENPEEIENGFNEILNKNPDYKEYSDLDARYQEILGKYPDVTDIYDLYQALEDASVPFYGVDQETEDGSEWVNTYYNKGYSDSMLGKVDALQKEVDGYTRNYEEYARWAKQTDPNRPGSPVNDPDFNEVPVDDYYRKTGGGWETDLTKSPYLQAEMQWLAKNNPIFDYETYAQLNKEMIDLRPYNVEEVNTRLKGIDFFKQITDPKNPGKFEELVAEVIDA